MCLVIIPTLSAATTINILSEQLVINLKVPNDTYTYSGSIFKAPDFSSVSSTILLPNSNPDEPDSSYFFSGYWGNTYQSKNGFSFLGSAHTLQWIGSGDYDPAGHVYNSSTVTFHMLFSVEGDGATLSTNTLYDWGSSVRIMDLTTGASFSGGAFELLSGHQYHVTAWVLSVNGDEDGVGEGYNYGDGYENIFELYFGGAQAVSPKLPQP